MESKENSFIPFIHARCCINCGNIFDISKTKFYKEDKMQFCCKKCYNQFTIIERPNDVRVIENENRRRIITVRTRFLVLRRDCFKCVYCGRSPKKDKVTLHLDHLIPFSQGGNSTVDNLVTSCKDCNLGKFDNELDEVTMQKIKEDIHDNINRYN